MNKCVHHMLMLPWPGVGPQKADPPLVRALFGLYAGGRSELTAAAQYFYNSLAVGEDADLGELFACVAQNEALHLKKLGQLILQYGGHPRLLSYADGRARWWSAGAVRYESGREAMLRQAIAAERETVRRYRQLTGRMGPAPRALIERILQDEAHHIELFQRALGEAGEA